MSTGASEWSGRPRYEDGRAASAAADRPAPVPLYGPRFQHDPARLYREMRRDHGPVVPILLEGDLPAWLVIGYREFHYVTSNPDLFARDCRRWNAWDRVPPDWPLLMLLAHNDSILYAEGAEHQRRAAALHDALAAIDQFDLRHQCERVADELIDAFAGQGGADLISQYAAPLPLTVLGRVAGMTDAESANLVRDMFEVGGGGPGALEAYGRVLVALQHLVSTRHDRPRGNMAMTMLDHPAGLTEEAVTLDIVTTLSTGQVVPAAWIGNAVRLMLTDDRFSLTLSGGRRSVSQALNEVLWEDTPTQNFAGRWAVRATQLGGQRIEAGDMLVLGLAAANADPVVRSRFAAGAAGAAGNHAHMSFSHGEHRCPYPAQEIAEIIARTAIEVLLDRLPDVVLAVEKDALVWQPTPWVRGLTALPVAFTPA